MKTREELLKNGYNLDANSMIYGEKLVNEILAAPTEEQMKCEWCHAPYKPFIQIWNHKKDTPDLRIRFAKESYVNEQVYLAMKWGNKGTGVPLDFYKIKFCPICGKKLFNKEQSNENYTTN